MAVVSLSYLVSILHVATVKFTELFPVAEISDSLAGRVVFVLKLHSKYACFAVIYYKGDFVPSTKQFQNFSVTERSFGFQNWYMVVLVNVMSPSTVY